jgi:hypothetical protein
MGGGFCGGIIGGHEHVPSLAAIGPVGLGDVGHKQHEQPVQDVMEAGEGTVPVAAPSAPSGCWLASGLLATDRLPRT